MNKYIALLMVIFIGSCTYSINMIHVDGSASDVIDETQSVTPSTSLTIPAKLL